MLRKKIIIYSQFRGVNSNIKSLISDNFGYLQLDGGNIKDLDNTFLDKLHEELISFCIQKNKLKKHTYNYLVEHIHYFRLRFHSHIADLSYHLVL